MMDSGAPAGKLFLSTPALSASLSLSSSGGSGDLSEGLLDENALYRFKALSKFSEF